MDNNSDNREKRRDLRVKTDAGQIKCQIIKKDGLFPLALKKTSLVKIRNLSVDGVYLELPLLHQKQMDELSRGQYDLVFELKTSKGEKPIKIKGKVVWVRKKEEGVESVNMAGIHFYGINNKDRDKILQQLISICFKTDDCLST